MSAYAQIAFAPPDQTSRPIRGSDSHFIAPQDAQTSTCDTGVSWSRRVRVLIWIAATIFSWAIFAAIIQGISSIVL